MTLVLVVTFALILIGQFVLFKNKPKNPPKPAEQPLSAERCAFAREARNCVRAGPATAAAPAKIAATPTAERKAANGEVETVVENNLYRIVFTNKGGAGQVVGAEEIQGRDRVSRWTWSTRQPRSTDCRSASTPTTTSCVTS